MLNEVRLIGHLGADPEIRYTTGGKAVCEMSVATTETWKDQQGKKQEHTEWHRVVVFGRTAEACSKHLRKGGKVHASGKLRTEKWQDKKDGSTRYATKVHAQSVLFLDGCKSERTPRNDDGGSYGHNSQDDLQHGRYSSGYAGNGSSSYYTGDDHDASGRYGGGDQW